MSNIYIQEPPTSGKVLLVTSVGDIEVELWSKEAPRACRNFVQLCMEGYYSGSIFHRVVKGFIAQGGDPTGTGNGGESIYGAPFKDEFHSRLRFVRRGLVAMASGGADDNGSQFFFTLGSCPDLQNKHTIFGKVVGETLYNMLRLEEGLVDSEDRPVHPHRIVSTQVLVNPFDDIIPRKVLEDSTAERQPAPTLSTSVATKNYKLLSFGDEAEEEEEELMAVVSKDSKSRGKSSHDLTDDASLSSVPAVSEFKQPVEPEGAADRVEQRTCQPAPAVSSDERNYFEQERQKASAQRIGEIRKEFRELRRQMRAEEQAKLQTDKQPSECDEEVEGDEPNQLMRAYRQEQRAYSQKKQQMLPKGTHREQKTLEALARFQAKMAEHLSIEDEEHQGGDSPDDDKSDHWLSHQLRFAEQGPVLAKDANVVDAEEAYSLDDPRNAMNERRRKRPHHEHSGSRHHKRRR
ncbi:spliceosome-associated protein CWC27 homolog isoform X2 [Rhipicephalus sanguineus]|uniref:spliceosome-associated protein CWC27 homolog isoform X2 n=1 Tax=Rhipicephalus sanguineus TaxID=34632 RepID=UPI0020C2CC66|nr:spliceosome-associated protein CWC27 homolog isoform X2 [Rhipicephalus sanguineus]